MCGTRRNGIRTALVAAVLVGLSGCVCRPWADRDIAAGPVRLLLTLPDDCNTPDGCALAPNGDIILSIPNFNNTVLLAQGKITTAAPAKMVSIDADNRLATWYMFRQEDMQADTGKVGPMGCAFGPDGNLYVADNQLFFDPDHKSRLLRIKVRNGVAQRCDVVAEGFIVANGVAWKGDTIYVSETILEHPEVVSPGQGKPTLRSGVYAIHMSEWANGPVKLRPYAAGSPDPHLVARYRTSNRIGFGADGVTFDADGNLYCGIFEDGIIYRTTFDGAGRPVKTSVFSKARTMQCCDGIFWRAEDKRIYVADMLRNGVQAVDSKGCVTTLHTNPDTTGADGLLDQPCEVIVRGKELIIVNMDMPWDSDLLTNKAIDRPYTLSVIPLK